ncbi:MAG TPA: RNA polymerase Rpb4 family protein [Euryarchaeota archaeon]|nr:RNA polymerase Rpb4 family protein [Euryarchaeota archaeon]
MSEQYVTLAEVRELLEAEAEIRGYDNLLQSQKAALDHAQTVCSISLDQANAIIDEVKQIDIVTDAVALKIADLLPRYPEDVRAIFSKERVTLEPAQIQQIIDIVEKHI